jgi:hypothetical protein
MGTKPHPKMGFFVHGAAVKPVPTSGTRRTKERRAMGLFGRRKKVEEESARCPLCRECVPDGADECRMCGADLKALGLSTPRAAA